MDALRKQLDRQRAERDQLLQREKAAESCSAAATRQAMEAERQALMRLKLEKLELLKDIPAKYRAELENFALS